MVRWRGRTASTNVEDRRGMRAGPMMIGGGVGGLVLVVAALLLGVDPRVILGGGGSGAAIAPPAQEGAPLTPGEDEQADYLAVMLADTEQHWGEVFNDQGYRYRAPTLVYFSDAVSSACGMAGSAVGPFYCPADETIYMDLSFLDDLRSRFGAPGDFAQAYVLAHEVGHHVQNQLGVADRVAGMRQRASQAESNALSVRMELQADCFAGVWGASQAAHDYLDPGDVEEGLRAAAAIGDDRLQRQAGGRVVPESFTHGSSDQRLSWFRRGFESGDPEACDTFAGASL
ncbi:MAG TPA: neutral zinc metallopeptidase [Longimicrobiales bacterium]|nr:neutral zinc metallopeptidase [Longimicrobiales bacterium]